MFSGSYCKDDVEILLKVIDIDFVSIEEKERLIQHNIRHYSEMLSREYEPSEKYLDIFYKLFELNKKKFARDILTLAYNLQKQKNFILVSLVRAGTPIGVLLKRTLSLKFNKDIKHYSVSIIRDKGIDENAINYIIKKNPNKELIFIDGWTGKGIIYKELKKYINLFNKKFNTNLRGTLYVVSDIAYISDYSVTNKDYLIPSSALNSTISGLISRSILNKQIKENDFHGCKYYSEFKNKDLSLWFVNEIMKIIETLDIQDIPLKKQDLNKHKIFLKFLEEIQKKYLISNINLIKPGIGETTRVLLRRKPFMVFIKNKDSTYIQHILQLANEKKIKIIENINLPLETLAIIKEER